jgi:hypothetical protein
MIALKRAYDPVSSRDGTRLLVERLWPRGISKARLEAHAWLKEALRQYLLPRLRPRAASRPAPPHRRGDRRGDTRHGALGATPRVRTASSCATE